MLIPYLPSPFPDELLGSWFARIKLHNGEAWWKEFLAAAGYAKFLPALIRIPHYDPRLDKLLRLLGMSFRTALLEHTELPYVMAFEDVEHPGLAEVPALHAPPRHRGKGVKEFLRDAPRYCPECLGDAFDTGEPFWRISHQLPNVAFCSVHETQLLTNCSWCGLAISENVNHLIRPFPLICQCGQHLSSRKVLSLKEPELHRRIRLLSIEAMNQVHGHWSNGQVRAYLREAIYITGAPNYLMFLERPEEDYQSTKIGHYLKLTHEETGLSLFARLSPASARSADLCASMAMLRRTFAGSAKDLTAAVPRLKRKRALDRNRRTMEQRLAHYVERWRSKRGIPPHSCAVYWFFRLEDPSHLSTFPDVRILPIPSVDEDRRSLEAKLEEGPQTMRHFLKCFHGATPLHMRITLRDSAWVAGVRKRFAEPQEPRRRAPAYKLFSELAASRRKLILDAIETLIKQVPPSRLRIASIARQAQLPPVNVGTLIANDPTLSNLVDSWNRSYPDRVCRFAIAQLHDEGRRLSTSAVLFRAKLSKAHQATAEAQLEIHAREHALGWDRSDPQEKTKSEATTDCQATDRDARCPNPSKDAPISA